MKKNLEELEKKYRREFQGKTLLDQKLIWRLIKYLNPDRFKVIIAVFLLLLARVIDAIIPIYIGHMAQSIINHTPQTDLEILLDSVFHQSFILLIFLLLGYLLDTGSLFLKNKIAQHALYKLRTETYEHILTLPITVFNHSTVGRLMTRTIHDVEQIHLMFTDSVIPLLGSLLLMVCMSIGILFVDLRLALLFIFLIPVVIWLTNHFRYYQRYCYDIVRNIVSAMNTFVQEYLMGFSIIKRFGLEKEEKQKFDELNQDHYEASMAAVQQFSLFISSIDFLQNFSLALVFAILVTFAPSNVPFDVGAFFTFSLYALMLFRPLVDLAERYNILQSAISAAQRIFHLLDQKTESQSRESEFWLNEVEHIHFKNVWFAYEDENWILKDLTFEIKQGQSIALVGLSGGGKTTLTNLLLRFYDFQKGTIEINGHDIKKYNLKSLRKCFSVVLQEPVVFSGTFLENIICYKAEVSEKEVNQVIDYLNLRPLISSLPKGLFQPLTEHGHSLSVGERQLLSLARAIIHKSNVLILDEATANIDFITEKIIQDALSKILKDKTALVIAHRLSTIKDVNKIIVLHEGKIAEMGTHQQLLRHKGVYEKLYRIQFNIN